MKLEVGMKMSMVSIPRHTSKIKTPTQWSEVTESFRRASPSL